MNDLNNVIPRSGGRRMPVGTWRTDTHVQLPVHLTRELYDGVCAFAKSRNDSFSEAVRTMLTWALDSIEEEDA